MAMRCSWPPENSCGRRCSTEPGSRTRSSSPSISSCTEPGGQIRCTRSASPSICATVMRGFSAASGFWNTICTWRWKRRRSAGAISARSRPRYSTRPSSQPCSAVRQRASVDLPEPLSPTMLNASPGRTARLTSSSARIAGGCAPRARSISDGCRPNRLLTRSACRIGTARLMPAPGPPARAGAGRPPGGPEPAPPAAAR